MRVVGRVEARRRKRKSTSGCTPFAFRHAPWSRFLSRRSTKISAVILGVLFVTSLVTLPFSLRWYNAQFLESAVRHPPALSPVVPSVSVLSWSKDASTRVDLRSQQPGAEFAWRASSWFGHDDLGRSLLYRILPGLLVSLGIGLASAVVAVTIGVFWGATAAFLGGRVDLVMMRIVDVTYGLPYILMVILLKIALTGPLTALFAGHTKYADLVILFIAIGGVSWLTMSRVIRGQVLSLRSRPFVEAARAAGGGSFYILWCHILPNLVGPIVTYAALVIPQAVLQESFLSFLGIGVQQPTPSLGRLAADGVQAVNTFVGYWWLIVFPCGMLVVTLVTLNFIGDALRDAFDPKSSAAALA